MKKGLNLFAGVVFLIFFFPKINYAYSIMFGASLFSPQTNETAFYQDATMLYVYPNSLDRHFTAPVFLPHQARVTAVVVFFKDNTDAQLNIKLRKFNVYSNDLHTMFSYQTEGASPDWQIQRISRITQPEINNDGYLYYISIWFSRGDGNELALKAIKIHYEI